MSRRPPLLAALLLAVLAVALPACGGASSATLDAPGIQVSTGVGFRSPQLLAEHYRKHGREFGDVSQTQYLRLAQRLRDRPPGGDIVQIVRPADGVVTRFDRGSGAFIAFNRDRTIRTFFKPNDGERYFRRQAGRAH